jgi:magnesium-transporting ATPase (P-type)
VIEVFLNLTEIFLTLAEVFPCFFLSCKANARVKLAKTGHGPHSSTLVVRLLFVLFCVVFVCICVLYYCHRVSTQLESTNISYHIMYHIYTIHHISYHIIYHIYIPYIIYIIYHIISYIISYIYHTSYIISYHTQLTHEVMVTVYQKPRLRMEERPAVWWVAVNV